MGHTILDGIDKSLWRLVTMNRDPRSPCRQRGPVIQGAGIKLEEYNLVPERFETGSRGGGGPAGNNLKRSPSPT